MIINLFGLTGLGNVALENLIYQGFKINALYTRKEKGPFPYYNIDPIYKIAKENNIKFYFVPYKMDWKVYDKADINIVITFHRILKSKHRRMAKYSINIHPSLLPKNKGKNPFRDIIKTKERICGFTCHVITDEIDNGSIILQEKYEMKCKTEAQLRYFLATKLPGFLINLVKVLKKETIK